MLIKHKGFVPFPKNIVKTAAATVLAMSIFSPVGHAFDSAFIEKEIIVKFKISDLEQENGVEAVYSKLTKSAKSACRKERHTMFHTGEKFTDCVADLIDQFITNANITSLDTYHDSKTSVAVSTKLASNTK
jgi:UrcA family protein